MVYTRLPFLTVSNDNDTILEVYKFEVFYELQGVFEKTDDQLEDEAEYKGKERSIVADIIAIQLLGRRAITNMEGTGGAAATGNKILKKAKAGSAETEFEIAKANDGAKVLMNAANLIAKFTADVNRKAASYGFIFDFNTAGELLISAMTGGASFNSFDYAD